MWRVTWSGMRSADEEVVSQRWHVMDVGGQGESPEWAQVAQTGWPHVRRRASSRAKGRPQGPSHVVVMVSQRRGFLEYY